MMMLLVDDSREMGAAKLLYFGQMARPRHLLAPILA